MDLVAALPAWSRGLIRDYCKRRGLIPNSCGGERGVRIDVGAHLVEGTLEKALGEPDLMVFGFGPNCVLAKRIMARAANFLVLPMAAPDTDGFADFFTNASDYSSSLIKMEESGIAHWKYSGLAVKSAVVVETIRLDTLMTLAGLPAVDYLKIDAEEIDLDVVKSVCDRLSDIMRITLGVAIGPDRLYKEAPDHDEVVNNFILKSDFELVGSDQQNFGLEENLTFTTGQPERIGV